jgi:hemolysin activation/secretion protein
LYASRYDDRHDRGLGFSRLAGHVEHYFPVFDTKRVIAIRLTANHLAAAAGSRVPFYYMPSLGGMDSHHGFDHLRFRDANTWIFSAENRWEAIAGMDLAVFYDRGGVAPRFTDLSLSDAEDAYGAGVRVGTESAIFLRAEVAVGAREGTRWFIGASAPFKLDRFLR